MKGGKGGKKKWRPERAAPNNSGVREGSHRGPQADRRGRVGRTQDEGVKQAERSGGEAPFQERRSGHALGALERKRGSKPARQSSAPSGGGEQPQRKRSDQTRKGGNEPALKTLDRVISKFGAGSRTEARSWIGAGRVRVNGKLIQTPDHWVDPARDRITLDGKPIGPGEKRYVLLYKPKGYLTTYKDPENRPTVYDLIKDTGQFLANAGRLDLDTSGLLLLTNDTQLAERLTNPEYHVPKTYLVKAATLLSDEQIDKLRSGVELEDGPTRPCKVARLRDGARRSFVEITITEGRNRQVRRMFDAVGSRVLKLVRTQIGPLGIGALEIGKWRELTAAEVQQLKNLNSGGISR